MAITYEAASRTFKLSTLNSDYVFYIPPHGRLVHLYYGKPISDLQALPLQSKRFIASFAPFQERDAIDNAPETMPLEISGFNTGDYRITSVSIRTDNGAIAADPRYVSHQYYHGKTEFEEMPSAFVGDKDPNVETLEITMRDSAFAVEYILIYSVFPKTDVIVRSMKIVNRTGKPVQVLRAMSCLIDFDGANYDRIALCGSYARERHINRIPLGFGNTVLRSCRGSSGHQINPALALAAREAGDENGDVYGFLLGYSGDFRMEMEVNQYDTTRVIIGLNPETFAWKLKSNESFQTPEVILTYSAAGMRQMSINFHRFLRNHWMKGPWVNRRRPILINNWEATYFDFDAQKILDIAKTAQELGIEMLVLDDGWFGNRNDDHSSLGDWSVNTGKIGNIGDMVKKINAMGLKFGLWFEPEMISEDSELFRNHPDWAIQIPGRERSVSRWQLMLDMSRPEIVDAIFEKMANILHQANIEYVKWDMNRNLTEVFSIALEPDRQKEVAHRFVLGVYRLYRKLLAEFPNLLIEGCSGGGGRFDAGILYYSPQIWCSDDSDAIERLSIQKGTALFYPVSTIGAHVSVCPNHMTGRITPFSTRGLVALNGTFGYELDLTKLSADERKSVRKQVAMYHTINDIVREGNHYRLTETLKDNTVEAWMDVTEDQSRAVVTAVRRTGEVHRAPVSLKLAGLEPKTKYCILGPEGKFELFGDTLMNFGMLLKGLENQDGASVMYLLEKMV